MRIIGSDKIRKFCRKHVDACDHVKAWLSEAKEAAWKKPQDIKNRYASASFLHNNVVIFNINGNHYRLVIKVAYPTQVILIKWLGTHSDYDKKSW